MKKINYILAITGSVLLIIAGCQDAINESEIAFNNMAGKGSTVDTVPKRSDTTPTRRSDTTMEKPDTSWRSSDTTMRRSDTSMMERTDTASSAYIDLSTGLPVELYYDAKARRTYSVTTNQPVEFYVNSATGDTIYGRGRYIVNNYIVKTPGGMYKLDNKRIKVEKDEIKIKDGNKKFKMEEGKMKMKDDGQKAKSMKDTATIRTDDTLRNQ